MKKITQLLLLALSSVLITTVIEAKVVRVEITERKIVSDEPYHAQYGPYEVLKGIVYFEVDPNSEANQMIVDLQFAPRNENGYVEFSSEFELHKPVEAIRGNRRLMYFVNNRGNKFGIGHFSEKAGKNWHYSQGYSYLWCGWNCDVIESDRRLNISVPVATENGKEITGEVYSEIISYSNNIVYSRPLVWGGSIAYEPVNMDKSGASLTMQQYRNEEPIEILTEDWEFARYENGEVIPDPGFLYLKDGIKPGWLYDLVYEAKNPKVSGLGMAAIRDVVSFFKYENKDENGNVNPLSNAIEKSYAWGHSQSGRLLNHFVHENFNGDEENRIIFEGVISNCPGAGRGQFNSRFAQFTRHGSHHEDNLYPIDVFPFACVEQIDPVTGEKEDAFEKAKASGFMPKFMYINSSTDYWTRAASLLHTDVEGKKDIEIDPNVRIYAIAGRTHQEARIGIIGRALLAALDNWVSFGIDPPESQIPKIADGTLVSLEEFKNNFPEIPEIVMPDSYYQPYRLELGNRWKAEGIQDIVPAKKGEKYLSLVPQVDKDGNELAGIKFPEISVPLATYTGWNMRRPVYSNSLGRNSGRSWTFPQNKKEQELDNDPRTPISERYKNADEYFLKLTASLLNLKKEGFLLDEDFVKLMQQANVQADLILELRAMEQVAIEENTEVAAEYYQKLKEADFFWIFANEWNMLNGLNTKGYELISSENIDQALKVFKLNTVLFPQNANVWDSFGEGHYLMKNYEQALKYYSRSVELNSNNQNGKNMIEKIKKENK